MGKTEIQCGKELVDFLRSHGMNNNQIAVSKGLKPATTEAFIKGRTDGSTRATVYAVLDAINEGLAPYGKRAEYRRGRENDYIEVRELPNPERAMDERGVDWLGWLREIQLALEELDPAEQKERLELGHYVMTANDDHRAALKALVSGLMGSGM